MDGVTETFWPQLFQVFGAAAFIIALETAIILVLWRTLEKARAVILELAKQSLTAVANNNKILEKLGAQIDIDRRLERIAERMGREG